jgi:iron-sulfur cluster assembly accessory protein
MTDSVSSYRPDSLNPGPLPPRNLGIPESSIAGGLKVDDAVMKETNRPKISEKVAQESTSIPIPSQSTATTTPSSRPAGKSRLRARKAAMTLTPTAVQHVRLLLDQPEPKLIRVGVKNKGCSGSAYHLEYVDKPNKFDEMVEQDGVKVLIDSKALIKVIGSEMDWVEDKLSARFTFTNPNISKSLQCSISIIANIRQLNSVDVERVSVYHR